MLKDAEIFDKERIRKKYELLTADYLNVMHSAKSLLAKDDSKDNFSTISNNSNLYWEAASLVARQQDIKLVQPPNLSESTDAIGDIARFSGLRYREVVLEGNWFKNKSGSSLIAFLAETSTPIAIINENSKKFVAYDINKNRKFDINQSTKNNIIRIAYVLYKPLPSKKLHFSDLLKYAFEGKRRDIKKLIFATLLTTLISLVLPVLNTIIFDNIIPNAQASQLWFIGYALFVAAIGGVFFELAKNISVVRLRGLVDINLQSGVWDRLLALPTRFFRDYTSGDLIERSFAVNEMVGILSGVTLNAVLSGSFTLLNFILLFYLSSKLATITLFLFAFLVVIMAILGRKQVKVQNTILSQVGEKSGFVLQLLIGISTLKTSGNETRAYIQWFKKFVRTRKSEIELERLQILQRVFSSTFYMLSLIVIYYSMIELFGGELTTGKFLGFNAAYGTVIFALMNVSNEVIRALRVIPIYNRLKPIVETQPEDSDAKEVPPIVKGNLEIFNVSFRYSSGEPLVLKNLSLKINEGDYFAIVGPSGCGKSTLVRLLLGFEQPEQGNILYENHDLKNIDNKLLRRQLGVVLQDGTLSTGDLFTNIIGASTTLTLADAWEAARLAGVEADIKEMPMGMHTIVTDEGSTLSGGQKQRIMIARALVHKPKILIFDEATSALDNRTQAIVTETLNGLNTTRIVIAHRLSTIMSANRIIYIDDGEILEQGTFKELMAKKGLFYKLAERQM